MDLLDAAHGQHFAGRLGGELVGAVAGADGHRQRVHVGLGHEIGRLIRVGQQLLAGEHAFRAVAVFLLAAARFERSEAAHSPSTDTLRAWARFTTSR